MLAVLLPGRLKLACVFGLIAASLLIGCRSSEPRTGETELIKSFEVSFTVDMMPLRQPAQACEHTFVARDLDHITMGPGGEVVREFEANGGGVAINDLDNDGDLDLILTNHRDPNTVFWNEGDLTFTAERMPLGDSRAVNVIDLDGDGWLDILRITGATLAIRLSRHPLPVQRRASSSRLSRCCCLALLDRLIRWVGPISTGMAILTWSPALTTPGCCLIWATTF
jgi:hypothetical protein